MILRTYQSRTRPGKFHQLKVDTLGNVFCDCEAAQHDQRCWHLDKYEGEQIIEQIKRAKHGLDMKLVLASKQTMIQETWEHYLQCQYRRKW